MNIHTQRKKFQFKFNEKTILLVSGLFFILSIFTFIAVSTSSSIKPKNETQNNSSTVESSSNQEDSSSSNLDSSQVSSSKQASTAINSKYKQFSGSEFHQLYETVSSDYSGVTKSTEKPSMTGNIEADKQIQSIAEGRGYKLRAESTNKKIQPVAQEAFNNLKSAAKKEANLNFVLVSGFRSMADQKGIFLSTLGSSYSPTQIANGEADKRINEILNTRSIPGYSRHHTGYTADFGCNSDNLVNFKTTACYTWISKNNYENAKRFGLIPSYPAGAVNQGPNPEEWEYVWVGESNLLK